MSRFGITCDSRKISVGDEFVAIVGNSLNGEDYIPEAIDKGAAAIVLQTGSLYPVRKIPQSTLVSFVPNVRKYIADRLAEIVSKEELPGNIITITGTNGKTSTTYFIQDILSKLGVKAASIGTLGIVRNDTVKIEKPHDLTSFSLEDLYAALVQLKREGYDNVTLEASSHGLDQYRLHGLNQSAVAFTSFGKDHLDYHNDAKEYFSAKLKLFTEFEFDKAVINADLPEFAFSKLCEIIPAGKLSTYGKITGADFYLDEENILHYGRNTLDISKYTPSFLCGFQSLNVICAMILVHEVYKRSIKEIAECLKDVSAPPGRMQLAGVKDGAEIYLDFAHTPDAFELILSSIPEGKRVVLMFGCGGNRDRQKRPLMGAIASRSPVKHIIVTDDNPRDEDPKQISKDIISGIENGFPFSEIHDRRAAISYAMDLLDGEQDMLIIAGKGQEDYQLIKGVKYPHSDKTVIEEMLS